MIGRIRAPSARHAAEPRGRSCGPPDFSTGRPASGRRARRSIGTSSAPDPSRVVARHTPGRAPGSPGTPSSLGVGRNSPRLDRRDSRGKLGLDAPARPAPKLAVTTASAARGRLKTTSTSSTPGAQGCERIDEPLEPVLARHDLVRAWPLEPVRLVVDDERALALSARRGRSGRAGARRRARRRTAAPDGLRRARPAGRQAATPARRRRGPRRDRRPRPTSVASGQERRHSSAPPCSAHPAALGPPRAARAPRPRSRSRPSPSASPTTAGASSGARPTRRSSVETVRAPLERARARCTRGAGCGRDRGRHRNGGSGRSSNAALRFASATEARRAAAARRPRRLRRLRRARSTRRSTCSPSELDLTASRHRDRRRAARAPSRSGYASVAAGRVERAGDDQAGRSHGSSRRSRGAVPRPPPPLARPRAPRRSRRRRHACRSTGSATRIPKRPSGRQRISSG